MMHCPACSEPNPAGKKFCGDCGAPLPRSAREVREPLVSNLHGELQAAVQEKYSEQKSLETNIVSVVSARLSAWAKMVGLLVGVPLALLTLVIGFLIVESYLTFSARLQSANRATTEQLRQARQELQAVQDERRQSNVTTNKSEQPQTAQQAQINARELVDAELDRRLKDQKVVEAETEEAVLSKLSDWAKLIGFFVGIPVGLLLVLLGFFGVKTFADLSGLISGVHQSVTEEFRLVQLRTAALGEETLALEKNAEALRKDAGEVTAGYQKLKEQLADVRSLAAEVKTLSNKVDRIEKITFEPSNALTPELEKRLTASLTEFQAYMQQLGFKSNRDTVSVSVQDTLDSNAIAYYDPNKNCMFVTTAYANDADAVFRQYTHQVLLQYQKYESQAMTHAYASIESGLAFYFPCSFKNSPKFGEKIGQNLENQGPYTTLINQMSFDKAYTHMHPTQAGAVWGGAFWDLRELAGQKATDKMLFTIWAAMKPEEVKTDDGRKFVDAIRANSSRFSLDSEKVGAIFERRGMKT